MITKINLYDFDHTIYKGDSSRDFLLFCLRAERHLWKYLPKVAFRIFGYFLGTKSTAQVKEAAFEFLKDVDDIGVLVALFWSRNNKKIAHWYSEQRSDHDLVLSASPEFLLQPIVESLGVRGLLGTNMNRFTGEIVGENCRGQAKVDRLQAEYAPFSVGRAYSDSLSDIPMLLLAREAFIVKKERLVPLEEFTPSRFSIFTSSAFLRFLAVGSVSAAIGVGFASVAAIFIQSPQLAFITGFSLSLIPSFFLNSIFTFRDRKYSVLKFLRFVVSYIPNFLVQFFFVHVFTEMFDWNPIVVFSVSTAIGVPITFALLSLVTFRGRS